MSISIWIKFKKEVQGKYVSENKDKKLYIDIILNFEGNQIEITLSYCII